VHKNRRPAEFGIVSLANHSSSSSLEAVTARQRPKGFSRRQHGCCLMSANTVGSKKNPRKAHAALPRSGTFAPLSVAFLQVLLLPWVTRRSIVSGGPVVHRLALRRHPLSASPPPDQAWRQRHHNAGPATYIPIGAHAGLSGVCGIWEIIALRPLHIQIRIVKND